MTAARWRPIRAGDEYADRGDTRTWGNRMWDYYWSESRQVCRRYGVADSNRGAYQERAFRGIPWDGAGDLGQRLSSAFYTAQRQGTLLVDEPAQVAA